MKTLGIDIKQKLPIMTGHGSPYDRGSADSYYRRGMNPHYYPMGTYNGERIEEKDMTEAEIDAYNKGYADNEKDGDYKEW